ncbi:hypothetical protein JCGZ_24014 [Jatropha curcas]|uniref:F-box associated domain-containing protein n=2 Tax=Jatropha curcas TaxID=180498 RepID=A0A067JSF3_JATCU|nr:hypothetical protein JCGZ_24014 [Jatropha curcas]
MTSNTMVKGSFNWIACKKRIGQLILSYNARNEDLEEIEFPDSLWRIKHITKLNDSLAVIAYRWNDLHLHYDYAIWVMNEYGVKESWTKKFIIVGIFGFKRVFGYQENVEGEFILLTQSNNNPPELIKYNPRNQEIRTSSTVASSNWIGTTHVYVESLVPV